MENLNFTTQDILQKEFKNKMRGYDPTEVDEFLDSVIKDYESYQAEAEKLQSDNQRLRAKNDELNKQVTVNKDVQSAQPNPTVTNFDILKRLSNLERHVFGAKLDDNNQDGPRKLNS
ncbi:MULTISPECIES: cell division regulator GpsB [Loigolactobacillus]|uniref:Cell cycle protein GpsB n=1 Tax=Loigolactobacillus backii TaxID=375175 RepID=A0A192H284_9LACO|nr:MULTISPECIES: cell division regulator GpsB [Loigolactobacillus]ANK59520.1 cell division protein GpsB [Loigolactobacillus backii]ANK62919.1 cell division protein GpsB [Loigolactobacillus backii]ANK64513.1 cell division protein GpsB [Loigolactobacillus backii]ANK67091.1 cell division protein GpsB [Loigolactobacillus backii]ANK70073.1 cell division protein GpsB [Loigolactobacillus backii]